MKYLLLLLFIGYKKVKIIFDSPLNNEKHEKEQKINIANDFPMFLRTIKGVTIRGIFRNPAEQIFLQV